MIGYLTNDQVISVLQDNHFGRLGCNDGYNSYIFPLNYIFIGKQIICQSLWGTKLMIMRQNKRVCLQVDVIEGISRWKSVLVLGEYEELLSKRNREAAMKDFVRNGIALKISENNLSAGNEKDLAGGLADKPALKPVIFCIHIDEMVGRCEWEGV